MNKKIMSLLVAFAVLLTSPFVISADTKTDAQNQKRDAENKLNSVEGDIESLEGEKDGLEEEIEQIDAELVDILLTVDIIEDDIANKQVEIDEATAEYEAARQREHDQQESMKLRIKFMYEKGDRSYLDMLIESQSISDLVNKSDYVEKLYAYDRKLLDEYQATREEVYELKTRLESEMTDLEELHTDYEEQSNALQAIIDEKRETLEDFETQLANAHEKANQYKAEIQAQTAVIRQIEAEEAAKKKAEEAARKKAEEAARKKSEEEAKKKKTEETQTEESIQRDSGEEAEEKQESTPKVTDDNPGNSSKGKEIANFALQYVGNPYVAGGTSLTEGCDCSGFTQSVYSHFGISLPRNSSSQSVAGREVSYESAQPGDIIYYGGHVGIYIGGGQIVHASTPDSGIKVSNALYRSVITVRRFV